MGKRGIYVNYSFIIIGLAILLWPVFVTIILGKIRNEFIDLKNEAVHFQYERREVQVFLDNIEKKFNIAGWVKASVLGWNLIFSSLAGASAVIFIENYLYYNKIISHSIALNFFSQKELGLTGVFSALTAVQLVMFSLHPTYVEEYEKIKKLYLISLKILDRKKPRIQ